MMMLLKTSFICTRQVTFSTKHPKLEVDTVAATFVDSSTIGKFSLTTMVDITNARSHLNYVDFHAEIWAHDCIFFSQSLHLLIVNLHTWHTSL